MTTATKVQFHIIGSRVHPNIGVMLKEPYDDGPWEPVATFKVSNVGITVQGVLDEDYRMLAYSEAERLDERFVEEQRERKALLDSLPPDLRQIAEAFGL